MKPIQLVTPLGALRLVENDVEKPYDGGRIVLVADNGDPAKTADNPEGDKLTEDYKIIGVTVVINYRKDGPMRDWPMTREDIEQRRFTLHITEESSTT